MADQITYLDKDKNASEGSPSKQWRDVDANDIKTVVNQHAGEIEGKVDKVTGKGLSSNDYTNSDKIKVSDITEYALLQIRDDGGSIAVKSQKLSSNFDEIIFTNPSTGAVIINSDTIGENDVTCFISLADFGFSRFTKNGSDLEIEIVDTDGTTATNDPLDGATILIQVI